MRLHYPISITPWKELSDQDMDVLTIPEKTTLQKPVNEVRELLSTLFVFTEIC